MKNTLQFILSAVAVTGLALAQAPAAAPTAGAVKDKAAAAAKDTATKKVHETKVAAPAPTAAEIADAKSKGMVWVNLKSGVFHKDGEFYGKTKSGKFMTEADATKAGYKVAGGSHAADKKPAGKHDTTKVAKDKAAAAAAAKP